jgi:hypothetical protein
MADHANSSETSPRVFISYAGADAAWAEWVAWHLEDAGFQVELDIWDWQAGDSFVHRMGDALDRADVVVALWSAAYFEPGRFTGDEWMSIVAGRGLGRPGASIRIVPLWVSDPRDVVVPPPLRHLIARRLEGDDEAALQRVLLSAMSTPTPRARPRMPGHSSRPRIPLGLPEIWNVPPRSLVFAGRDDLLGYVRSRLRSEAAVAVLAVHGLGGVGKTLLAIELAHRYSADYDIIWWVDTQNLSLVPEQMATLGVALGVTRHDDPVQSAAARVKEHLRSRERWLVIFDNAEDPSVLRSFLPEGSGHVLITRRPPGSSPRRVSASRTI